MEFFKGCLERYLSFAVPGLGMFSEAYIIFSDQRVVSHSAGLIGQFHDVLYPECFESFETCPKFLIQAKIVDYIQIVGVMIGMMSMGIVGDMIGRKMGSRAVAAIMLSGVFALFCTSFTSGSFAYFVFFLVAQTWYGVGVGGEYPLASSSAAEKAEVSEEFRKHRGREVVLVFSNQGMGNLVNTVVILCAMHVFGETSAELTPNGSKHILMVMYGVGCAACAIMVFYRFTYLEESEMFIEKNTKKTEAKIEVDHSKLCVQLYWSRQIAASMTWLANDFAFYGNKLQQSKFISFLYPDATPVIKMQWTVLNSFISLLGYYAAAMLVDKPWYGRRRMQIVGFFFMFAAYGLIFVYWSTLTATVSGIHLFQALYYLSSFFNQFGPNATTWLIAGEIFPTAIRTTNHGIAATMGKAGAIIATVWIININDDRNIFLISCCWAVAGMAITWAFLPDTTGLNLKELDDFHEHAIKGALDMYHGEAINPKHLSPFERLVFRWHRGYHERDVARTEISVLNPMNEALISMTA